MSFSPLPLTQSDPDLPADVQTPSSTELGRYPGLPFSASQYIPPQPSIEEARQTMHSLLDDAFALVAPSSQPWGLREHALAALWSLLSEVPAT